MRARERWMRPLAAAVLAAALLGACSDIYVDRRETLTLHAGDAKAANVAVHAVDPWPRVAENNNIPGNGERQQKAIERYRTNKVTPLQTTSTSSVSYGAPAAAPAGGQSP
jgi:hypothetical protein